MAIKKIQMRPPENNYVDILHPETEDTMVVLTDGTTLNTKSATYTNDAASGTVTVDLSKYNIAALTPSAAMQLAFSNVPAGFQSVLVRIAQPASPSAITYSGTIKWNNDAIPYLSAGGKTYTLVFHTINQGTTWVGQLSNQYTT